MEQQGITREEAFTKVLNVLESQNNIKYSKVGKFKKQNLLEALSQIKYKTWEYMGYSCASSLNIMYKEKIVNKKIGKSGWEIFLLSIINMKYCKKCEKCYDLECFNNSKDTVTGKYSTCKYCLKEYRKDNAESIAINKSLYYNKNKENIVKYKHNYYIENKSIWEQFYIDNKDKILDEKLYNRKEATLHIIDVMIREGKIKEVECGRCGYKENWAALEFHHINSELERPEWAKSRTPSQYILGCKKELAEKRYLIEIDNLELLCANCHMKHHSTLEVDNQKGLKLALVELGYTHSCEHKECNEVKHLELHHNIPKDKIISFRYFYGQSKKRIIKEGILEKEMKKDVSILCRVHHREYHNPKWILPIKIGENNENIRKNKVEV